MSFTGVTNSIFAAKKLKPAMYTYGYNTNTGESGSQGTNSGLYTLGVGSYSRCAIQCFGAGGTDGAGPLRYHSYDYYSSEIINTYYAGSGGYGSYAESVIDLAGSGISSLRINVGAVNGGGSGGTGGNVGGNSDIYSYYNQGYNTNGGNGGGASFVYSLVGSTYTLQCCAGGGGGGGGIGSNSNYGNTSWGYYDGFSGGNNGDGGYFVSGNLNTYGSQGFRGNNYIGTYNVSPSTFGVNGAGGSPTNGSYGGISGSSGSTMSLTTTNGNMTAGAGGNGGNAYFYYTSWNYYPYYSFYYYNAGGGGGGSGFGGGGGGSNGANSWGELGGPGGASGSSYSNCLVINGGGCSNNNKGFVRIFLI